MALSIVSGSKRRSPLGTRWLVEFTVDDVTSTADVVSAADVGLTFIENVVVQAADATVAVQAKKNVASDGSTASNGSLYLDSASTTTDVYVMATGRG